MDRLVLAILVIAPIISCERNPIYLYNNGYTDILVAINERIAEDEALLDRIKTVFTDASEYIYAATKHRSYFRNITILIPRTWSDALMEEPAAKERFEIANVIVDEPNPDYGDNPYTRQTKPCGIPGDYMHFTERYLMEEENSLYYWGEPGKVVVHEWAHLRWGTFDEYPVDDDEHFYYDENGRVEPTRCSEEITGQTRDTYDRYKLCNTDPDSGVMPGPGCMFFPDLNNNPGTGSYAYANYLDSVVDFCHGDSGGKETSRHNVLANNKQNKQCDYMSVWDIMLSTDDFINGTNPPRSISDTTPTFRIVQEIDTRVVLVLDVSWSMNRDDRLSLLHQAATRYLQYTVPNNTWVGIVEFDTDSTVLSPLVLIDGNETRQELVDYLPTGTKAHTCIGCGLLEGVNVLEDGPYFTAAGGILFLITDGKETTEPLIGDVIDDLVRWKVIVDTLALSDDADPKLTELSTRTGGRSFYYSGSESTALNDALTESVVGRGQSEADTSIQLTSYREVLQPNSNIENYIHIDSSIGRETRFIVFWELAEVHVELMSPTGSSITNESPEYHADGTMKAVIIEITGKAAVGEWRYTITNTHSEDQSIQVAIESKSADISMSPIRVQSTLSSSLITESPPKAVIYADVHQGYLPVTNAVVIATVERPNPLAPVDVRLRDNGAGADITKDDGVYSGYFVDFVEASCGKACRYSVRVTANNQQQTASSVITGRTGALPRDISVIPNKTEPVPVGNFDRTSPGGAIQVGENVEYSDPYQDSIAPDKIKDLKVTATSFAEKTVTLSWSAVGDDFDQGKAFRYIIRTSKSMHDLLSKFEEADEVLQETIDDGTLTSPLHAGSTETLTIRMSQTLNGGYMYYFRIVAVDESGNHGLPSNIVQAALVIATNPGTGTEPGAEPDKGMNIVTVLAIAIVITAAVLVISVAVFVYCKVSRKTDKPDPNKIFEEVI